MCFLYWAILPQPLTSSSWASLSPSPLTVPALPSPSHTATLSPRSLTFTTAPVTTSPTPFPRVSPANRGNSQTFLTVYVKPLTLLPMSAMMISFQLESRDSLVLATTHLPPLTFPGSSQSGLMPVLKRL